MEERVPYSGVENLEVMQEAANYNRYLLNTIRRHAPTRRRILDFGAGNGQFALPLSRLSFDITALEPDESLRHTLRDQGIDVVAALQELPNHSFEYAYTLNVLEHIEDDVQALRHLHSKLTAQGRLLVYVPAFPILYTAMDAKVGHMRRYTRGSLAASVKAAGFRIDHIAYVDSIGFFATLLFKLVGNRDGNISLTALKLYDRLVFPISRGLDAATHRWFGKNLLLLAGKKTARHRGSP